MENQESETKLVTRRNFLAMLGAGMAGVTLVELPYGQILQLATPAPEWRSFVEKDVSTICQLCSAACGLRVRTLDGFPVSVKGNPLHPISRGKLCPKGVAALQSYYHPARIAGPQIKRDGKFVPISWEEAIGLVGQELTKIRDGSGPQDVCFLHGELAGLSWQVARKFTTVYGTPNLISLDGNDGVRLGNHFTFGGYQLYAYDLDNSAMILSLGSRLLESWDSPVFAQRVAANLRDHAKDARLVHVDSRFSTTAARADEWLAVRPGTEGALALGVAYVLIKESLYDVDFVDTHSFGFDEVPTPGGGSRPGFKQFVLENYHPFKVSKITGVATERIISLAKSLASISPSVVVVDQALTQNANGVLSLMAANALNALLGAIDRPGGVLKPRKLLYPEFDRITTDAVAQKGLAAARIDGHPLEPASRVTGGLHRDFDFETSKNTIKLLFVQGCNPAHYTAGPSRFRHWMKAIPFTVSFANVWDETAAAATLVLPEHHFLDRWQDVPAGEVYPYPVVGLAQPVGKRPLHDTRHFIDILGSIAAVAGEPLKGQMSLPNADAAIKGYFEQLYAWKRGTVFMDGFATAQVRTLEERGWWSDPYGSAEKYWDDLVQRGGWWDPAYTYGEWSRIFTTPTRKYEFFSQNLQARFHMLPESERVSAFPRHVAPSVSSSAKNYPLYLNVYEPLTFARGTGGDIPWLIENPSAPVEASWETWVEINPETAASLGIEDGARVVVESATGTIRAIARYFAPTQPDIVALPLGLGRTSFDEQIPTAGSNALEIVSPSRELLSGTPALLATMVKVYKP